ncbi:unnamed protein product [Acanthoscelides obtectus]|uniref:Uncharacterized protein n=1 Tax=Acanthoscelides obtectus TaxID=200917 RepID=A0A9P0NVG5_ACAOB|nr:unnamed protein product [Acanthoscelides obtectus]CAK1639828.1 hypothetical protein AOBTE_LOCUS11398 [Acanthoscelides obtectus]
MFGDVQPQSERIFVPFCNCRRNMDLSQYSRNQKPKNNQDSGFHMVSVLQRRPRRDSNFTGLAHH